MGGSDNPNVHLNRMGATETLKLSVLNDLEQLGLQVEREFPNLIQKKWCRRW